MTSRICKVPMPKVPTDTRPLFSRKVGDGESNHTVAKFKLPVGSKILGIETFYAGGYRDQEDPVMIFEVPAAVRAIEEREIHLFHAHQKEVAWVPEEINGRLPQGRRQYDYLWIPEGLRYVGCYRAYFSDFPMIFVYEPIADEE